MYEILEQQEQKSYYLNLREFASGEFEAVVKVVKPLRQEAIEASMNGALTSSRNLKPRFVSGESEEREESATDKTQNHNRAVRRAKQNIRWLAKVMEADRLFTLTYRDNVTDREKARADFKAFLRLVRSGWRGQVGVPNWQYVAVLEKQQRGALHIHCAVKGWQRINFLRQCWYKALGCSPDVSGENTPGNVDVTNPDKKRWGHTGRQWKVNKLAGYLTKYLGKTFDESTSEKKRYWHNRDLKTPVVQRHWVGGASIPEAIQSAYSMLELHCGVNVDCSMWVSTANDYFWIAGCSR